MKNKVAKQKNFDIDNEACWTIFLGSMCKYLPYINWEGEQVVEIVFCDCFRETTVNIKMFETFTLDSTSCGYPSTESAFGAYVMHEPTSD